MKPSTKMYPFKYAPGLFEQTRKLMKRFDINVISKIDYTLGSVYYDRQKNCKNIQEQKGCIYDVVCECGDHYIGETSRKLKDRLYEHRYFSDPKHFNDNNLKHKSAIAEHVKNTGHKIQWNDTKILGIEENNQTRKAKEAIYIKKYMPAINISPGVEVPPQWFYLF